MMQERLFQVDYITVCFCVGGREAKCTEWIPYRTSFRICSHQILLFKVRKMKAYGGGIIWTAVEHSIWDGNLSCPMLHRASQHLHRWRIAFNLLWKLADLPVSRAAGNRQKQLVPSTAILTTNSILPFG